MRKYIVILAVLALVGGTVGCASLFQKACNPTADEKATIDSYKAQATTLLAFLQSQVPVPEVQAAIAGIQFAISIYDQVLAGVCVAIDVVQNADNTVKANQTMARAKMKYQY